MRPNRAFVAALLVGVLAGAGSLFAAEPKEEGQAVIGKVEAVTLYRGQAMVTRRVPVEGPAGAAELLVGGLPQRVVGESLFAEGAEGIEVRAVRFRTRAVEDEPREEVRQLDEQIQGVEQQIARNKKMQEVVAGRLEYLNKLEGFTAPTAKVELTKGVLNVDTLKQLTLFAFEERQKAADEALQLQADAQELAKQLALLQRKRQELTRESSRTIREALIFLDKQGDAPGELRLSYLADGCGWSPAYNLRTNEDRTKVEVEYNAIIQQMSGEDWDGVRLTLSTASPTLSAEAPGLAPFRIALQQSAGQKQVGGLTLDTKNFQGRQQALANARAGQQKAQRLEEQRDANWRMNVAANDVQNYELLLEEDRYRAFQAEAPAPDQGPSVSYQIDSPVSLASRSDQQMLRILESTLDADFYSVASPILTSYVYREARIENTGEDVLLAGQVSVYLDGRFVGRGEVPTVAQGESFVMGFGADPQLRARRERIDRTDRVQGGNREISVRYRITLENFKDREVAVRVFDRRPVSSRETDIRVTLGEMSDELSDDKLYRRIEEPKGILRWDIQVPAKAAGEDARTLEYGYKLEFARTLSLSAPSGPEAGAMRQEFEELQQRRYQK